GKQKRPTSLPPSRRPATCSTASNRLQLSYVHVNGKTAKPANRGWRMTYRTRWRLPKVVAPLHFAEAAAFCRGHGNGFMAEEMLFSDLRQGKPSGSRGPRWFSEPAASLQ